eukprot:gene9556-9718_t
MPKQFEGAKPPIVIAAHGLGAQKDFGLSAYGERFAEAGLASLIFDYRTFGGSDGQPRHWVSPRRHLQDWRAAVEYVQTQLGDKVQANRMMLWGTSFAGGHALTTAAELGSNITAVVAQVPFLDGKASFTRSIKEKGILRVARAVIAGIHDKARSFFTYPAAYFPLTGRPGSICFMGLSEDDEAAYYSKHPPQKQGGWRNLARCSLALEVSSYRPITLLHKIKAPVLFIAAAQDKLCPAAEVEKAAAKTPHAKFVAVDCGHFDVYSGQPLQHLMDEMVAFYKEAAGMVTASNTMADVGDQVAAAAGDIAAVDDDGASPAE